MPMPETAMNQYHRAVFRHHDIWSARKIPDVQPESETAGMQTSPHHNFRLGVFASDTRHDAGTGLAVHSVHMFDSLSLRRFINSRLEPKVPNECRLQQALKDTVHVIQDGSTCYRVWSRFLQNGALYLCGLQNLGSGILVCIN